VEARPMKKKFSPTRGFLEVVLENLAAPDPKKIRKRARRRHVLSSDNAAATYGNKSVSG
jgi:hypothetical protein